MKKALQKMKKRKARMIGAENGMVVMLVLILIITLSLLAAAANRNVVTDIAIASNHLGSVQAFYAADAGAQYGFNQLWLQLQLLNPNTAGITFPTLTGYTFNGTFIQAIGGRVQRPATGTFAGLSAFVQRWRVTSTATEANTGAKGMVTIDVEDQLIPIFQFGVFYNHDLEILPGANMTFTTTDTSNPPKIGRIHTNSNIYLAESGSSVSLTVNAPITSAGNLYAYRKDGTSTNHNVYISNGQGSDPLLNIDSTSANWAAQSQTTWLGQVKTIDHGITSLNVPMPVGGQPINLLGTGQGSFDQMAGLVITDLTAKDKNGNPVTIPCYQNMSHIAANDTGCGVGNNHMVNPITIGTVYDYRQGGAQTVVNVDLAHILVPGSAAQNALDNPPTSSDKGILYISSSDSSRSVRLQNGATSIPTEGLTIASNLPVYVQGDYNTANNPAAIAADAVTVLSNNWEHAGPYGAGTSINSRPATATTVNAAFMVGNKDTAGSQYSGGLENLVRFLENWSGVNFTYKGSLVCLWQSAHANANWPGTGTVYNPPNRIWQYGMDINHLPPGTPRVRYVMKLGWRVVTN